MYKITLMIVTLPCKFPAVSFFILSTTVISERVPNHRVETKWEECNHRQFYCLALQLWFSISFASTVFPSSYSHALKIPNIYSLRKIFWSALCFVNYTVYWASATLPYAILPMYLHSHVQCECWNEKREKGNTRSSQQYIYIRQLFVCRDRAHEIKAKQFLT